MQTAAGMPAPGGNAPYFGNAPPNGNGMRAGVPAPASDLAAWRARASAPLGSSVPTSPQHNMYGAHIQPRGNTQSGLARAANATQPVSSSAWQGDGRDAEL